MLFHELNYGKCKTYLIACENTRKAALIDPVKEKVDRYLATLAYYGCTLDAVIDTHTHADHRTASLLRRRCKPSLVLHHPPCFSMCANRRNTGVSLDIYLDAGSSPLKSFPHG